MSRTYRKARFHRRDDTNVTAQDRDVFRKPKRSKPTVCHDGENFRKSYSDEYGGLTMGQCIRITGKNIIRAELDALEES